MIFIKILRNNKRIGEKHDHSQRHLHSLFVIYLDTMLERVHLLMSNEKSFLFLNTVYYVVVF